MLFDKNQNRRFLAKQTNGEKRPVTYTIAADNTPVIIAVDDLPVSEYPLSPQFNFVVMGWIDDHRKNLGSHADFFDNVAFIEMHELTETTQERQAA